MTLLSGEATLELSDQRLELRAGDTVLIPRHTPHRALATSRGATRLAVHVHADPMDGLLTPNAGSATP